MPLSLAEFAGVLDMFVREPWEQGCSWVIMLVSVAFNPRRHRL